MDGWMDGWIVNKIVRHTSKARTMEKLGAVQRGLWDKKLNKFISLARISLFGSNQPLSLSLLPNPLLTHSLTATQTQTRKMSNPISLIFAICVIFLIRTEFTASECVIYGNSCCLKHRIRTITCIPPPLIGTFPIPGFDLPPNASDYESLTLTRNCPIKFNLDRMEAFSNLKFITFNRNRCRKFCIDPVPNIKISGICVRNASASTTASPQTSAPTPQTVPFHPTTSTPRPKPKTTPRPKPKTTPHPEPKTTSRPKPKTTPRPKPKTTPRPKPKTTPRPKSKTTPRPKPKTTPRPKPKTTTTPSPKPKTTTTPSPKPKTTTRPSPKTTSHPQSKTTSRPKPKTTLRPEPKTTATVSATSPPKTKTISYTSPQTLPPPTTSSSSRNETKVSARTLFSFEIGAETFESAFLRPLINLLALKSCNFLQQIKRK